MGFWILMAILACALAVVVVALAIDRPQFATNARSPGPGAVRWLAVVADRPDQAGRDWAERLEDLLPPTVEHDVVRAPGSTLSDLRSSIQDELSARNPNVLLIWTAQDDVLAGTGLGEYELALSDLLAALADDGVLAVVGNVPDLSRLPGAASAGLPEPELRHLADRWNAAVARLAHHHGALVADLSDLAPDAGLIYPPLPGDGDVDLAATTDAVIAERFVPLLRQALVGARRALGDDDRDSL